jgi:uncharacterized protein YbjQ (UPF0145 family)
MLVVTTENVAGYRVRAVKGQVFGIVVRSRGIGGNVMAGLRSMVGGEIPEYTEMLEEARKHAIDRMVKNATAMEANAVVMMRFDSSEIGQTMSEIVALAPLSFWKRPAHEAQCAPMADCRQRNRSGARVVAHLCCKSV